MRRHGERQYIEGCVSGTMKVKGGLIAPCFPGVVQLLMHHLLPSPDDTYTPRSPVAITAVAWAPDGSVAASGNRTGELTLWHEAKAVATAQVNWVNLGACLCDFCPSCTCTGVRRWLGGNED